MTIGGVNAQDARVPGRVSETGIGPVVGGSGEDDRSSVDSRFKLGLDVLNPSCKPKRKTDDIAVPGGCGSADGLMIF